MHFRKASTPWRVYDALTLVARRKTQALSKGYLVWLLKVSSLFCF